MARFDWEIEVTGEKGPLALRGPTPGLQMAAEGEVPYQGEAVVGGVDNPPGAA